MEKFTNRRIAIAFMAIAVTGISARTAFAVVANARTFASDEKASIKGVIVSRTGSVLKLKAEDGSVGTVDLTDTTKIQLRKSFGRKTSMDQDKLMPGLSVEAQGRGNEKGELVAEKVLFDPNSLQSSRQIDSRVSPLETRAGTLEGRADTLENRAGQMEGRQGQLETAQKQTDQQVGVVKGEADQANQGVSSANERITNLDNYKESDSVTVYFKLNSYVLSDDAKKDLDTLAQKAIAQKGYVIEVAGFADKTGKLDRNQVLSEHRADAVTRYLEQQGNIPIHRILTPTGMGISHEAADNQTEQGRKMNRRVEVKVLTNQGLVAGASQPQGSTTAKPANQ